jgi:CheY-like chemotaxis protein
MRLYPIEYQPPSMKDENNSASPLKTTIMLVDDNEIILTTLSDYLQSEGFIVIACQSGKDAIRQAKINYPALIVMDVQMPEMDGIETTQRLKADKKLATTPIIALTALAMKSDRDRCLAVGMNDYISKPVSLQNLVVIIKKHLNMQQEISNGLE